MRLHTVRLGLSVGIVWAFGVLLLGGAANAFDWGTPAVQLLESVYLGFAPTLAGLLIGVIGGFLIGWVYNRLGGLGVQKFARRATPTCFLSNG
jgi:hypothetical protein